MKIMIFYNKNLKRDNNKIIVKDRNKKVNNLHSHQISDLNNKNKNKKIGKILKYNTL